MDANIDHMPSIELVCLFSGTFVQGKGNSAQRLRISGYPLLLRRRLAIFV